jgi:signal peptidase I
MQSETPSSVTLDSAENERLVTPAAPRNGTADFFESLLLTMILGLFGTTFIVQAFKIPSESMEPTLLVGDHLLVNKFILEGSGAWYEKLLPYRAIHRGDVVVFKFPFDDHPHYVKRVLGLPGDHLRIVNQIVYVNGIRLTEPYAVHDPLSDAHSLDNFPPADRYYLDVGLRGEWAAEIRNYVQHGELVVPSGRYFMMGDNRDRSWDSRYWGFVGREAVIGRPFLVYWSVDATAEDYSDRSLWAGFRGMERTFEHLSTQTRWHRMLHEVH